MAFVHTVPVDRASGDVHAMYARIEAAVGAALIALADLSVVALREVQADGRITRETRAAGGTLVAKLYEAQQVLGTAGFDAMARRQGGRLRRRHGHLSATAADAGINDAIRLVVQVDATMKAWMH